MRRARPRAERRHDPSGPPLGAVPAAIDTSASWSVRSAAERQAATPWSAASCIRASDRCTLLRRSSRGARGCAQIAAAAHHGRLQGRPAALSASTAHGAMIAPRHAVLRPRFEAQAASAHGPAATPETAAEEAARKSPLLPTTAASSGDPRLFPHLRLIARRTSRRPTCEGRGGCSCTARSVGSMAAERPGS